MGRPIIDRRKLLLGGSSAAMFGILPARAAAQSLGDIVRGLNLPPEVNSLVPKIGGVDAVELVKAIIELEKTADVKGIPQSKLAVKGGFLGIPDPSEIYRQLLPRAVALVDRTERIDFNLAEQAGGLLAKLHSTQYLVADGWGQISGLAMAGEGLEYCLQRKQRVSTSFGSLSGGYSTLYNSMEIRPNYLDDTAWHLKAITEFRSRYEALGSRHSVPWFFIAVIHGLEASYNFRAHLHNGDHPLGARTRQVPAGRPLKWLPPSDWESSATDALRLLGFTGQSDWSLERILYRLEAYNGFGYRLRSRDTPYLWSYSNHYDRGKFVADGKFDANARSQQCGAAVILKLLEKEGVISISASPSVPQATQTSESTTPAPIGPEPQPAPEPQPLPVPEAVPPVVEAVPLPVPPPVTITPQ